MCLFVWVSCVGLKQEIETQTVKSKDISNILYCFTILIKFIVSITIYLIHFIIIFESMPILFKYSLPLDFLITFFKVAPSIMSTWLAYLKQLCFLNKPSLQRMYFPSVKSIVYYLEESHFAYICLIISQIISKDWKLPLDLRSANINLFYVKSTNLIRKLKKKPLFWRTSSQELRPKHPYTSVAVPPVPLQVRSQRPLAPIVRYVG